MTALPSDPDPRRQSHEHPAPGPSLSHLDTAGRARMVDTSGKVASHRLAEARVRVELTPQVRDMLMQGTLPKGDALAVARVAAIQAAKATSQLIPLCHPLPLDHVDVQFAPQGAAAIEVRVTARCHGATGVEMEAMTAAAVAALTVYDMSKALCRGARITDLELLRKTGGKSGTWQREVTS